LNIIFRKQNNKYGQLECIRDDQSRTQTKMPEQGIAPHDLIHFVIEKTLDIKGAFYGQLKAGADISFKLDHNQASLEIANRVDVWQTEAMVESLQSMLWSKELNFDSFNYLTEQACILRKIPKLKVTTDEFNGIKALLTCLNNRWLKLNKNETITVKF